MSKQSVLKTDEEEEIHFQIIHNKITDINNMIQNKLNEYFEKQLEIDNHFNQQINNSLENLIKKLIDRNVDLENIYHERITIEDESNKSREFSYMIYNYLNENKNLWKN